MYAIPHELSLYFAKLSLYYARFNKYVRPLYPRAAKKKGIQGTVQVRAVISKAGDLTNVEVLKGDSALVPAAVAALKQWRYRPCLLNGNAIDVITVFDVSFNLNQ